MATKSKANQDVFKRANELIREGYERKQAFAIAYRERDTDLAHLFSKPKKNPVKRKTAARTQRAAVGYVNRPSQITKKAPSKRLKKRRTKNLQVPRGVFPNPITKFIVYSETKPGQWKQVKVTENFDIAKNLAISNANSGYASTVEDSVGTLMYDTTRPTKYELKKNPDSVHFDIDVNSHNARGSRAKTRVNPARRAPLKYFIATKHAQGTLYFDGVGFSKLKSSAVDFRNEENVTKRAVTLADFFQRPMQVLAE